MIEITTIIIKVFIKYKILSIETILSAHTHTHTHTHTHKHTNTQEHFDYTSLTIYTA